MKGKLAIMAWGLFLCLRLSAQETGVYTDPNANYKQGLELFQQQKYTAAQEKFRQSISEIQDNNPAAYQLLLMNSRYYDALCSKNLLRPDAEKLFLDLVSDYGENPVTRRAYFQLVKFISIKTNMIRLLPGLKR
jgi:TolA-binding protein